MYPDQDTFCCIYSLGSPSSFFSSFRLILRRCLFTQTKNYLRFRPADVYRVGTTGCSEVCRATPQYLVLLPEAFLVSDGT